MCCSIHTLWLSLSGWLWSLKYTSVKLWEEDDRQNKWSLIIRHVIWSWCDVFIYLLLIVSQQTYFPRVGCQNSILTSTLQCAQLLNIHLTKLNSASLLFSFKYVRWPWAYFTICLIMCFVSRWPNSHLFKHCEAQARCQRPDSNFCYVWPVKLRF